MASKKFIIAGAGNIGSHLVAHVARTPEPCRIIIIDPDIYSGPNAFSQDIFLEEVSGQKAQVQAKRVSLINPYHHVEAIAGKVQSVPLGKLRGGLILGCVDNNDARMYLSQASCHLGCSYIDAGVRGDGLLARISVFVPGPESPCMECSWTGFEYGRLMIQTSCDFINDASAGADIPSNSPSALGALAASLQAIECGKVLQSSNGGLQGGRQIVVDAVSGKIITSRLPRNPDCSFDHQIWTFGQLEIGTETFLRDALDMAGNIMGRETAIHAAAGDPFLKMESFCPVCQGGARELFGMRHRLMRSAGTDCVLCHTTLSDSRIEIFPALSAAMPDEYLDRTLESLGFLAGDIIQLRNPGRECLYCEIQADMGPAASIIRRRYDSIQAG